MSVKLIEAHEVCPAILDKAAAYLYVTNSRTPRQAVEKEPSRLTIYVDNYSEVSAAITDWLYELCFSPNEVTLGIYSDCDNVSAGDVACIAHMILPRTPIASSGSGARQKPGILMSFESLLDDCVVSAKKLSKPFTSGATHV